MDDKRMVCKYGSKCYQKNPAHHEKYRHPPKRVNKEATPPPKRFRTNSNSNDENPQTKVEKKEEVPPIITENTNETIEDYIIEENSPTLEDSETTIEKVFIPADINEKEFIKEKFLVDMPEDFYQFYDLCLELNKKSPLNAFSSVGLTLVGPFDVLAGKFAGTEKKSDNEYLLHWRYYYDVPEFQTVIKENSSKGFHIGYFRDEPKELPVFMAANTCKDGGNIEIIGENIFASVFLYLEDLKKSGDPFKKMHIAKFQQAIKTKAESLKLDLSRRTSKIKDRNIKVVTKTFNTVGLVVPYNKKTELGYRGLTMNDKDLKTLLTKMKNAEPEQMSKFLNDLQPVLTFASIATDECDFGTGIELGWDLLYYGIDRLNGTIASFLSNSYNLLNRNEFASIASAHMKNRKKGFNLSII